MGQIMLERGMMITKCMSFECTGAKLITKYLVRGLKAAEEEYGGEKTSSDLQATLTYLAAVEQLKSITEEGLAIALVEQHDLRLQHLVVHLQQIPQVSRYLRPLEKKQHT